MPAPKNKVREFVCIGCGKTVVKSCVKKQKYCSPECYHAHREYRKPKMGVYKICINCGKKFYVPQGRSQKAIACSVKCHNEYQGRNKVHLICKVCGKEFVRSPFFCNQKYCSIECKNNDPDFLHTLILNNTKRNKLNPSKFESVAYSLMDSLGIVYEKQYIVNDKFTVDAFVPTKNTAIQFDGDYWHGNTIKFPNPDNRQKRRMELDKIQDEYLNSIGIKVIRIWQSDFNKEGYVENVLKPLSE